MRTKEICASGLMIALVAIGTMIFQIPVSSTSGYIHLGDSLILLVAVFFGKKQGMIAGGIGSALADILSGFAHWALFTLIIKGIMGFLIGSIADFPKTNGKFLSVRNVVGGVVGISWMVFGYFIGGSILKSSVAIALLSIPENILQGVMGYAIFVVVGFAFYRGRIYKYISFKS